MGGNLSLPSDETRPTRDTLGSLAAAERQISHSVFGHLNIGGGVVLMELRVQYIRRGGKVRVTVSPLLSSAGCLRGSLCCTGRFVSVRNDRNILYKRILNTLISHARDHIYISLQQQSAVAMSDQASMKQPLKDRSEQHEGRCRHEALKSLASNKNHFVSRRDRSI